MPALVKITRLTRSIIFCTYGAYFVLKLSRLQNMSIEQKKQKINKKTIKQIEKITGGKLTLGKLIWTIRECEEASQVDFAEKLGCSKQHLCDVEHDRKNVSPRMAADYAEILGYSREQFIRLALQSLVDRDGLRVIVEIKPFFKHSLDSA